jgi:IrrE N-terminal-like domain
MRRAERLAEARRHARRLHGRLGVRSADHVRVEAMAEYLGAEICEGTMEGASAQLVSHGDRTVIMLARHVTDPGAQRFSIAHELGHLLMRHPSTPLVTGWPRRREQRRKHLEVEANAFAAELLMPSMLLRRRCEVSPVDLKVPRQIAAEFKVSLPASAIRFVELTSEPCAAVMSERGVVRWAASSASFRHPIRRGRRVARDSLAWHYFAAGTVPEQPQRVPARAWLERSREAEIIEHATGSPELGTVLSMLWMPGTRRARR